jgi:hypothetical protein
MATVNISYIATSTITITLASLATSATRVAGRESTAITNTSNKYLDYLVGGKVTTGTTPTDAKQIDIWVVAPVNDTPLYPDVFDGTDSDETATSTGVLAGCAVLAASISTNNTSDRTYWVAPFSVASLFGGRCPLTFSLFVTHDTGVNLNSTGSNHAFYATGITETVT